MARIVVTGASGFLGRHVVESLSPSNEVIGVAFQSGPQPAMKGVEWMHWDIGSPPPAGLFPSHVDAVIHLAQARDYRRFPELAAEIARVNLAGLINVLDAARIAGARRFVLASSGGVYAAGPGLRRESDQPAPGNYYLATKLAGELLATGYRSFFDVICLRLFFPYGPGQPRSRFIPDLVRRVVTGEAVQLNGIDGLRANPVHAIDAASAFHKSLTLDGSHVINVAGPDVLTLRQMVEVIGDHVGREPVLEEIGDPGSRDLVADTTIMAQRLGAPSARFRDSIAGVCHEVMSTLAL